MTVVFTFKQVNFDDIKKEMAFKYKIIVAPFQLIDLVFDYFAFIEHPYLRVTF